MKIQNLHSWEVEIEEAREVQLGLSQWLILEGEPKKLSLIAGADVSYSKEDRRVWGGVVIIDIKEWEVIEERGAYCETAFPYIPGYLSFREMPVLLKAFEKVQTIPDVVLLDGQGIAHPRQMGIASHMGLFLDMPSVGCAKKRFVGESNPVGREKGSRTPLRLNEKNVGWVLRTREGVRPVFVSPGHRIALKSAVDVVLKSCRKYRLPEPLRKAHHLANRLREQEEE